MSSADCTESDSCASSTERRVRQQNAYYKASKKPVAAKKQKKKKVAIPVQTPRVPPFGSYVSPPEIPLHYQRMAVGGSGPGEKSMCRDLCFLFILYLCSYLCISSPEAGKLSVSRKSLQLNLIYFLTKHKYIISNWFYILWIFAEKPEPCVPEFMKSDKSPEVSLRLWHNILYYPT